MKKLLLDTLINDILPLLGTYLAYQLATLLRAAIARVRSQTATAVMEHVLVSAEMTTGALLRQTYARLKAAAGDGVVTPEELASIREQAVSDIRAQLAAGGVKLSPELADQALSRAVDHALRIAGH